MRPRSLGSSGDSLSPTSSERRPPSPDHRFPTVAAPQLARRTTTQLPSYHRHSFRPGASLPSLSLGERVVIPGASRHHAAYTQRLLYKLARGVPMPSTAQCARSTGRSPLARKLLCPSRAAHRTSRCATASEHQGASAGMAREHLSPVLSFARHRIRRVSIPRLHRLATSNAFVGSPAVSGYRLRHSITWSPSETPCRPELTPSAPHSSRLPAHHARARVKRATAERDHAPAASKSARPGASSVFVYREGVLRRLSRVTVPPLSQST